MKTTMKLGQIRVINQGDQVPNKLFSYLKSLESIPNHNSQIFSGSSGQTGQFHVRSNEGDSQVPGEDRKLLKDLN